MKELFSIPKPPLKEDFINKPIEMSNNIDLETNKETIQEDKSLDNNK